MRSSNSRQPCGKVRLLGWTGYAKVVNQLKTVKPVPEDACWWLEDEYRDEEFVNITTAIDECKNADAVNDKFVTDRERIDFVVVDREYKDRDQYKERLNPIGNLGTYPEKVLHSALPLLAARHYYTVNREITLLPVRFGTNGVVCNQRAITILRDKGVIAKDDIGDLEKFDLDKLHEAKDDLALVKGIEFCRWKWDPPINRMLDKASRNSPKHDELKISMLALFCRQLEDWTAMGASLQQEKGVVILGPSEMLAAPINSRASTQIVDWFLVKGAGLMWVESIACIKTMMGEEGDEKAVRTKRSNWLAGTALRLMADPWDAVRQGDYWGYPVLGWSVIGGDSLRKSKAIKCIEQIAGSSKVKGLSRGNPGEWMSTFLLDASVSLRDHPTQNKPISDLQRVMVAS